jgi:large conductance mechanosensitive channel
MLKEFKAFAMRGNVLDLAIGVILGGAFGKIVSSFVSDIMMPPIGLVIGKIDFTNLFISLNGATYATLADAKKAAAPTLNIGLFLNQTIDFIIVAFAIFLVIKGINKMQKPNPAAPATTKSCDFCLSTIALGARRCPHCTSELSAV